MLESYVVANAVPTLNTILEPAERRTGVFRLCWRCSGGDWVVDAKVGGEVKGEWGGSGGVFTLLH